MQLRGMLTAGAIAWAAVAPAKASAQMVVERGRSVGASAELVPRPARRGVTVFQQHHRGLVVLGRGAAIVDGPDDEAWTTRHLESRLPENVEPTIPATEAARIAAEATAVVRARASARLVLVPSPGGARLAWKVTAPPVTVAASYVPVVLVDALAGRVLAVWSSVRHVGRARVFEANPVTTPDLVDVTLPVSGPRLENERVRALNCVDHGDTLPTYLGEVHVCHVEPVATADANGDFLQAPAPEPSPEDEFAEVSLFHHTNRGLDYFESLGIALSTKPLPVTANLMYPAGFLDGDTELMSDPTASFEPLSGAFFRNQDGLFGTPNGIVGPSLWFGQGKATDYAYDGDVVYHELGHAVTSETIRFVPYAHADRWGLSGAPGGLDEGLSDYFSAAVTGDPALGEYAAKNLEGPPPHLRSLDNDRTCPESLSGENHNDGQIVFGGLWSVRQTLPPADHHAFDQAVADAMLAAPSGDLGYHDFAHLVLAALGSSSLDATVSTAVENELTSRGVLPECERVLTYAGSPLNSADQIYGRSFLAPGHWDSPWSGNGQPAPFEYAPAVLQVRATVPPDAATLEVFFGARPIGLDDEPEAVLVVRWSDAPIQFEWQPEASSNADAVAAVTGSSDAGYAASVPVPDGADVAHFMIANVGNRPFFYDDVEVGFEREPASPADAGVPAPTFDAAPEPALAAVEARPGGGGCACRARSGQAPARYALIGLVALAGLARRRLSRSRDARRP